LFLSKKEGAIPVSGEINHRATGIRALERRIRPVT